MRSSDNKDRPRSCSLALVSDRVVRGPHDDPNLTDDELLARRESWFRPTRRCATSLRPSPTVRTRARAAGISPCPSVAVTTSARTALGRMTARTITTATSFGAGRTDDSASMTHAPATSRLEAFVDRTPRQPHPDRARHQATTIGRPANRGCWFHGATSVMIHSARRRRRCVGAVTDVASAGASARLGEGDARDRRDHEVEGVGRVAAVRPRIAQRRGHVEVLEDRHRPTVRADQRQGVRLG